MTVLYTAWLLVKFSNEWRKMVFQWCQAFIVDNSCSLFHTGSQWAKQCVRKYNMALSFNSRLNVDGYCLLKSFSAAVIRQSAGAHATLVSLECHSHIFSLTVTLPPKLLSVLNKKHDTASGFHVTRHTKGLLAKTNSKGNIYLSSSLSVRFFHPAIYSTSDTLMLTVF